MSIGNHTFWIIAPIDPGGSTQAVTMEHDKRCAIRFTTFEAAKRYHQQLEATTGMQYLTIQVLA